MVFNSPRQLGQGAPICPIDCARLTSSYRRCPPSKGSCNKTSASKTSASSNPTSNPCKDTLVKLSYGTATRRDIVVRPSFKSKLDAVMTCAGTAKFKLSINSSGRCKATEAKSPHMSGNGIDFNLILSDGKSISSDAMGAGYCAFHPKDAHCINWLKTPGGKPYARKPIPKTARSTQLNNFYSCVAKTRPLRARLHQERRRERRRLGAHRCRSAGSATTARSGLRLGRR
jgi:hypothetical protein